MLIGREAEQRRLAALLDTARAGQSEVLAVVGEAGVGKSALLDDTASRAADMTVLRARGVQSETHVPFAGLFELLRPALGHLDRLSPPQAVALQSALALPCPVARPVRRRCGDPGAASRASRGPAAARARR